MIACHRTCQCRRSKPTCSFVTGPPDSPACHLFLAQVEGLAKAGRTTPCRGSCVAATAGGGCSHRVRPQTQRSPPLQLRQPHKKHSSPPTANRVSSCSWADGSTYGQWDCCCCCCWQHCTCSWQHTAAGCSLRLQPSWACCVCLLVAAAGRRISFWPLVDPLGLECVC